MYLRGSVLVYLITSVAFCLSLEVENVSVLGE